MTHRVEILEGWVLDVACLRRFARDEILSRAKTHTTACALEGHCRESGYGLVGEDGGVALLDAGATLAVADAVRRSPSDRGHHVRVRREGEPEQMKTVSVDLTES